MIGTKTAIGIALSAYLVSNILQTTRPFQGMAPFSDASRCTLLDGPRGTEDIVAIGETGWIVTSALDFGVYTEFGVNGGCDDGGLYAFNVTSSRSPKAVRLHIENWDQPNDAPCFRTHGLHYSGASRRLYAVTHHGTYSSVEIFGVAAPGVDDHQSAESSPHPPILTWIRSVRDPTVPNFGWNDVVEGANPQELYVTQFLPSFAGMPRNGRKHADTWIEWVGQALLVPSFLFGLKLTKVHVCSFDDTNHEKPATCQVASPFRFQMANGITKRTDKGTVYIYVNDPTAYQIHEFQRLSDGTLKKTNTLELLHAADNIEYRDEALFLGSITDLSLLFLNENKKLEDRALVPGGASRIPRLSNGTWGSEELLFHHDGSILSQVSSSLLYDGKIYLGSPYSRGILQCDHEQS